MKSFQDEIPSSRVNIKLDLHTGGSTKQVELPLKLLVVGDFSHGTNTTDYEVREKITVNKNNFEQVLGKIEPKLRVTVPDVVSKNNDDITVELNFKKMADFRPENIVNNVPKLKKMLAMRNLLVDLKSNVIDNKTFRKELENIVLNSEMLDKLKLDLPNLED